MVSKVTVQEFLHNIFVDPFKRRDLLFNWHGIRKKASHERLAHTFAEFLSCILYTPMKFHIQFNSFHFFGPQYPIQYDWLTNEEQKTVITMVKHRQELFLTIKEYQNNQCDYYDMVYPEQDFITLVHRRQLARDFVWLVFQKKRAYLQLELIAALQSLLLKHKSDIFVATLEQALQGRAMITEVPCWDIVEWDRHEEDNGVSKRKKT
jgi:hypothetical protein